jgi:hypothetical protein
VTTSPTLTGSSSLTGSTNASPPTGIAGSMLPESTMNVLHPNARGSNSTAPTATTTISVTVMMKP